MGWMLLVAGCTAPLTEIVLVVDTDLDVPSELDRVHIVATDLDGVVRDVTADLRLGAPRPVIVGLVSGDALRRLVIVATGEHEGSEVVRRTASVRFVSGHTVVLRLELSRSCVGVACGELTCSFAACRSIEVDPSELIEWSADGGFTRDAGEDASVDGGELDASLDAGVLDAGVLDAGVLDADLFDAGLLDSGFDGGFDGGLDAGLRDTGVDAGAPDGGRDGGMDGGAPDGGAPDGGRPDAPLDGGRDAPDAFVPECITDFDCRDGLSCTTEACALGRCTRTPVDAACDDGTACTSETCSASVGCVYVSIDARCDDGVACTSDRCDGSLGCTNDPVHTACALGDYCDPVSDCSTAPTFAEVYGTIISVECTPCHTSPPVSGTLDMTSVEMAFASLVDITAACGAGANTRVVPRDARISLLWRKVAGVDLCGARMPRLRTPLSAAQIDAIAHWIDGGAPP